MLSSARRVCVCVRARAACVSATPTAIRRGGAPPSHARPRKRGAVRRTWITGQSAVTAHNGYRAAPRASTARTAGH